MLSIAIVEIDYTKRTAEQIIEEIEFGITNFDFYIITGDLVLPRSGKGKTLSFGCSVVEGAFNCRRWRGKISSFPEAHITYC